MSSMVPYSQIHEQKQQRPLAPSGYHNAREPTFRDPFPSGAPAPHPHPLGNVPRNQQFAEGSEYYTWTGATHQQYPATAAVRISGPQNSRSYHPSTVQVSSSNPISKKRLPVNTIISHHQQQQRPPQPTPNQLPNSSNRHPHPHSHDQKHQSPKSDNHSTESPSTGDYRTPQRSRHGTPNQSRRGSAICTNGPLQCHYRNCGKRFATDREWR